MKFSFTGVFDLAFLVFLLVFFPAVRLLEAVCSLIGWTKFTHGMVAAIAAVAVADLAANAFNAWRDRRAALDANKSELD